MLNQPPHQPPPPNRLPNQRWQIYPDKPELATQLAHSTGLPSVLAQVLINRGIETPDRAQGFLNPESLVLPEPMEEFPDLALSVELLQNAIASRHKIAICGDYDADGMTSTALLLRALRYLGANVDYAIPSRMQEGYGINLRIVEEFHSENVRLILTVDNGISAHAPIARARELGIDAIVTDHHDLPPELPPATAILNPKLIREDSPYRGVAGVGVAYILAIALAQQLNKDTELIKPMRELLTLGTIADLAPLTGVNRRWVKWGLRQLPQSNLAGVQALIQVSGAVSTPSAATASDRLSSTKVKVMKPDEIGFRLGPRINAVGRIGDPQIVIELLTTDDPGLALERAMQCEQINQRRQQLCEEIELDAIAKIEQSQIDLQQERVLVIVQPNWHHGVIGIVASRLVERYGVPVFIGTYEGDLAADFVTDETDNLSVTPLENPSAKSATKSVAKHIRGSARSIPEFHVFKALEFCHDLLDKYGGHRAAGGFSLPADCLEDFRQCLRIFAHQCLDPAHLKPLVKIDAAVEFHQINLDLYRQIDALHPCGIENPAPVFWTPNVEVVEQKIVGKGHLKLTLQTRGGGGSDPGATLLHGQLTNGGELLTPQIPVPRRIKAIAWRWGDYSPLPPIVDVAYKLQENTFNNNTTVELEIVGVRLPIDKQGSRGAGEQGSRGAGEQGSRGALVNLPIQNPKSKIQNPITLIYPKPPQVLANPQWFPRVSLEVLLSRVQGTVLLYGARRPVAPASLAAQCHIEYDRPKRPCNAFVLWTLPPSGTHMKWLLAIGSPRQIYVYNQLPPLPSPAQLRGEIAIALSESRQSHQQQFPSPSLNLLQLGEQWWVAPCTIVAALRELGYPCPEFPYTYSLEQELERLYRWYAFPAAKLAKINWLGE